MSKTQLNPNSKEAESLEMYHVDIRQRHPCLEQADQCIRTIIEENLRVSKDQKNILDLGCGWARLTFDIIGSYRNVLGIDSSEECIAQAKQLHKRGAYAKTYPGRINFLQNDFVAEELPPEHVKPYDIIFMQRVMNHIHGADREMLIQRCFDLLAPNGILIIGDEFIKKYKDEKERCLNVCKFYLHLIGKIPKEIFYDVAGKEVENLIENLFSRRYEFDPLGENKEKWIELCEKIFDQSKVLHQRIRDKEDHSIDELAKVVFEYLEKRVKIVPMTRDFVQSDPSISSQVLIKELNQNGLDQIGQTFSFTSEKEFTEMAVVEFMKK